MKNLTAKLFGGGAIGLIVGLLGAVSGLSILQVITLSIAFSVLFSALCSVLESRQ